MFYVFTWLATVICVAGTVVNVWRNNLCFYLWAVGEVMWAAYDLHYTLYSRLLLDLIGLALAVAGAIRNPVRSKEA